MKQNPLDSVNGSLFMETVRKTFTTADVDRVTRAYAFSKQRAPALASESFQAADLLLQQNADAVTIVGTLLVPLLWEGLVDHNEIRTNFGEAVATTLEGLDSPSILRSATRTYRRNEIHALLTAMAGTPKKALLLIAFRLVALENAIQNPDAKSGRMALETLHFYVPIANRLSLGHLRRRLEDASFHILDPGGYDKLMHKVAPIQAEDDKCLQILLVGVQRLLNNNCIKGHLQGRTKSLHGVHRKMTRTGKTLEEIMDRIGIRVIVTSVPDCYAVLGLLHSHFKPIAGTFDDYIGLPKDNGYQSLHTCVYPVREISHKPIEFQVRTELMHMEAEHGTAAHWRYKNATDAEEHHRHHARWIEGLVRQHDNANSAEAFIETLHRQVFDGNLVVFGSGGRIVRLAENATVRDYFDIVNVHVPEGAVIKLNGDIAAMDRPLRDGDTITIAPGP